MNALVEARNIAHSSWPVRTLEEMAGLCNQHRDDVLLWEYVAGHLDKQRNHVPVDWRNMDRHVWAWVPGVECTCASTRPGLCFGVPLSEPESTPPWWYPCPKCRGTGWSTVPLWVKRTPVTLGSSEEPATVSYVEAVAYCRSLGRGFRLPTDKERAQLLFPRHDPFGIGDLAYGPTVWVKSKGRPPRELRAIRPVKTAWLRKPT